MCWPNAGSTRCANLGARANFLERASTAREACRVAVETLAQNPSDLPFVAALLVERA